MMPAPRTAPSRTVVFVGLWMLLAGTAALAPRLTGNSFDMLLPPLLTITGQWFLLRDRAWWATRWAVCGVVGALLPAVAAIVLHVLAPQSPLPRNQVYAFLLQVVAIAPAVLLLVPLVGARSFALLLAPTAAWAIRHYAIGPIVPPPWSAAPSSQWPPLQFALPAAVRGLVEAGVLTWLVAVTHRVVRASTGERPAVTAGTAASTPLGLLAAVWALTVLVVFLMLSALSGGNRGYAPAPGQTLLIVLIVGPYAVGLATTLVPMARPFGLSVLTVGAGGVALIGGLIAASRAGWLLLGGPAGLLLLCAPALHGAVAAVAFRAMWLGTAPARRSVALVSGAVLILLYAIAAQAGFPVVQRQEADQRNAEARARPDFRVNRIGDDLDRCFYLAARASVGPAWPRTVDDLGPNGLRCLTADDLRPADNAYAIRVTAPTGDAPPASFFVCVTRIVGGRVSARVLSERQSSYSSDGQGENVTTACANAAGGTLGRARYCLWDWAATHGGEYPETLDALMASGECLGGSGDPGGMRLTYVPGRRGADGRIATFVIIDGPTEDHAQPFPRYRLDETGTIRSTNQPRLPISRDPLDRLWQRRPLDYRSRGDQSGVVDWARTCDAGRLEDCIELGAVLEARAARWPKIVMRAAGESAPSPLAALDGRSLADVDLERALDVYRAACRASSAEGCAQAGRLLLKGRVAMDRDREVWTLRARACDLGDAASCDTQSAADAPGRPQGPPDDARVAAAACAGGSRTACTKAGRLAHARSGPHEEVLGLFLRGCDLGDAEACFEASHFVVGPDLKQAAALRAIACSMAPEPEGCAALP
jgi:hypothetical protein